MVKKVLFAVLMIAFAGYSSGGRSGYRASTSTKSVTYRNYTAPMGTRTIIHNNHHYNYNHAYHGGFGGNGFMTGLLGGYVGGSLASAHNYPVAAVAPVAQVVDSQPMAPVSVASSVNSPVMTLLIILIAILFVCIVYLLIKTSRHDERW